MKNIDVVALLNQKNAASKKAPKAQPKAVAEVEEVVEVAQEPEALAEEYTPVAEVASDNKTFFDSFKETKAGRTAEAVWNKAVENKKEIALVAAGITVVAVIAGLVRHKHRTNILKSFNEDK